MTVWAPDDHETMPPSPFRSESQVRRLAMNALPPLFPPRESWAMLCAVILVSGAAAGACGSTTSSNVTSPDGSVSDGSHASAEADAAVEDSGVRSAADASCAPTPFPCGYQPCPDSLPEAGAACEVNGVGCGYDDPATTGCRAGCRRGRRLDGDDGRGGDFVCDTATAGLPLDVRRCPRRGGPGVQRRHRVPVPPGHLLGHLWMPRRGTRRAGLHLDVHCSASRQRLPHGDPRRS